MNAMEGEECAQLMIIYHTFKKMKFSVNTRAVDLNLLNFKVRPTHPPLSNF